VDHLPVTVIASGSASFEQVKKPRKVVDLLALLEKMFVLVNVRGFSRNLRKEVTKTSRYYFADVGLVNARRSPGFYFWRTYDQHEIDLVEDIDGRLTGFEGKWSATSRAKAPTDWRRAYPEAGFEVVTRENWRRYLEA
jgi:predicted AAA+ superfamily ATPase